MKRYFWATLLAGLLLATTASATMVRQEWNDDLSLSRQAIIDFLIDLVNPVPVPDVEVIQDATVFSGSKDQYVAKFYGWVTVPETGTYQFHYACDDYGMLYVSQDEEMKNAVEVAYVDGWCAVQEWNKYPSQHSAPMDLKKGQVMAVMCFFVEDGGGDNMDLGWTGPGLSSSITAPTYLTNYITHIPPVPSIAKNPVPADESVDIPRDGSMAWASGKFAATHDVYLGTTFEDVNAASRTDSRGVLVSQGQADATFNPDALEYGQTYYWRIDEVNGAPDNTIFRGKVWSFTAEPFAYPIPDIIATASSAQTDMGPENTINGSGLNAQDQHGVDLKTMWMTTGLVKPDWIQYEFPQVYKVYDMLVWNSNQLIESFLGFGAKSVTIEYSVDGQTWTTLEGVPEFAKATCMETYEANTTVSFGGVMAKFVKLTINANWGGLAAQTGLSEVRFSYVPVQGFYPVPADGTTAVSVNTDLAWRPGREATSNKVYIGTDSAAVADGTAAGATPTGHSYTPGALDFGTTYYWKVDETGDSGTYAGNVWSFVTEEYGVIDNFETYNDDDARIYDSWVDGLTNGASGSQVGYDESPFAEKTIKHGGNQSMPLMYDNTASPYYSEAEYAFSPAKSLTSGAADTLAVYYRGKSSPAFAEGAGSILMNGLGADIWGTSDTFRFAYKSLSGNGTLVARVDSLYNSNTWAKAGVMIRAKTDPGSLNAFAAKTAVDGGGAAFQWRLTAAADSVNADATTVSMAATFPYWVKVQRNGNVFTGYISPDGVTWTQLGQPQTIVMTDPVMIGLAVCSHDAAIATSAEFSNVTFTGNVTGGWQMAEVGATQPEGQSAEPVYITITDSSGKSKTVVNADTAASGRISWQEWLIPQTEFTAAGVKMNAVKSIIVGIGDKTSPKAGGVGTVFIDDIGFGRPIAP
ncbi:MAG: discoidin domain-containing protein [Solirubrobacterales bacterium]